MPVYGRYEAAVMIKPKATVMSYQSDETTSLVVTRHYKTVSIIHQLFIYLFI